MGSLLTYYDVFQDLPTQRYEKPTRYAMPTTDTLNHPDKISMPCLLWRAAFCFKYQPILKHTENAILPVGSRTLWLDVAVDVILFASKMLPRALVQRNFSKRASFSNKFLRNSCNLPFKDCVSILERNAHWCIYHARMHVCVRAQALFLLLTSANMCYVLVCKILHHTLQHIKCLPASSYKHL